MYRYASCGRAEELSRLHLLDCMECGSCAYTCPGKLPLVEQFRKGKALLRSAMAEKAKGEKK
jgi:electron transport complex protein RnfC